MTGDIRATGERIERLLDEVRAIGDARVPAVTDELLRLLTDLYGSALARIVAIVGEDAPGLLERLSEDELVSSLLAVHGVHPEDVTARVQQALSAIRPFLSENGCDVALVDVDTAANAVLVRLHQTCGDCQTSLDLLECEVVNAVVDAVPEVGTVDFADSVPAIASVAVTLRAKAR